MIRVESCTPEKRTYYPNAVLTILHIPVALIITADTNLLLQR